MNKESIKENVMFLYGYLEGKGLAEGLAFESISDILKELVND